MNLRHNSAKSTDPLWCAVVLRRAAAPLVWLSIKLHLSANTISVSGTLLALVAGALIAFGGFDHALVGVLIFNFIAVLDCVDGAVARKTQSSGPAGAWYDAQMGYTVYAILPLSLSCYLLRSDSISNLDVAPEWLALASAATAAMNLYARVLFHKFNEARTSLGSGDLAAPAGHRSTVKGRILAELGMVGLMMPALYLCLVFELLHLFVFFYFIIYVMLSVATSLKITKSLSELITRD